MDELENSRFTLITYKPQVSYPSLTDDFLTIILPKLKQKSNFFLWSIEADETPDKHIHIFLKLKDTEHKEGKIKQNYLNFKAMKDFLDYAKKDCNCNHRQLTHPLLKNELENHMAKLGYCLKENPKRYGSVGISEQLMTECLKFYWSTEKCKPSTEEDWDLITPKNVYTKLPHIFKTHNIDPYGHDFLYNCSIKDIGIANISPKQLKTAYCQLKIKQIYKDKEKTEILHCLKDKLNTEYDWHDMEDYYDFHEHDSDKLNRKNIDLEKQNKKIKEQTERIIELQDAVEWRDKEIDALKVTIAKLQSGS